MISICVSVIRGVATRSQKLINESIVFMRTVSDTHCKMRVCLGRFEQSNSVAGRLIMPDDSVHPAPRFRSVVGRPFIEDGAHSFTVESQPESVLLRKLGNLRFPILIV